MLKNFSFLCLVILLPFSGILNAQKLPDAPLGYKWQAIPSLSDEFNDDELNHDKWESSNPYSTGREPSQYFEENAFVSGGMLHLMSTVKNNKHKDNWIWAAVVSSTKKEAFYGYYEARIKCSSTGMSSGFWLRGDYSEIDVMENFGEPVKDKAEISYESHMRTHYYNQESGEDIITGADYKMPVQCDEVFNIYGVWWKNSEIVWMYLNGKKVAEIKPPRDFLEKMYLIFDTEVFKDWTGEPTLYQLDDDQKNTAYVDWVHSYTLVEAEVITDCSGEPNGKAYLDDCGQCVGGITSKEPCVKNLMEPLDIVVKPSETGASKSKAIPLEVDINNQGLTITNLPENISWTVTDLFEKELLNGNGTKVLLSKMVAGKYFLKSGEYAVTFEIK